MQRRPGRGARKSRRATWPPPRAVLDRLLAEATTDAHDDDEQLVGIFTMLQEALHVPFDVSILGVNATVEKVDLTDAGDIVAICRRGFVHQRIPILALPLPGDRPAGAEWIEAYRRFARRR